MNSVEIAIPERAMFIPHDGVAHGKSHSANQLSAFADVPLALAELVVMRAEEAGVGLRSLRSQSRLPDLVRIRWQIAAEARRLRFSYWQIARALNRDHSTIIHAVRALT